jgi:hypothetical protein
MSATTFCPGKDWSIVSGICRLCTNNHCVVKSDNYITLSRWRNNFVQCTFADVPVGSTIIAEASCCRVVTE